MKHFHYTLIAMLTVIGGALLLAGYWTFLDPDIVTFKSLTFSVDKKVYHRGEHITYILDYCKRKKAVATLDRALVDGFRQTYVTIQTDLPTGCHTVRVADLVVPIFVGPGVYYLEGTAVYTVNPLRKQYVYWKSGSFLVE